MNVRLVETSSVLPDRRPPLGRLAIALCVSIAMGASVLADNTTSPVYLVAAMVLTFLAAALTQTDLTIASGLPQADIKKASMCKFRFLQVSPRK